MQTGLGKTELWTTCSATVQAYEGSFGQHRSHWRKNRAGEQIYLAQNEALYVVVFCYQPWLLVDTA